MKNLLKTNSLVLLIIFLSALLRFYNLGINPPSLNWDETAHGYNAYSILKTAKDEYGYKLPLSFRSFDDYKPPLYTYLVVPSIKVFGLSNYTVRFPSAFLGVFAVLFTYLMVLELFKNKKLALFSAFFLAISPWHLQFSRVAFETNSATFWSVLGTWAFLKGINTTGPKITVWMSLSALAFGANLFMYHNARVFIPIYASMLFYLYKDILVKVKKYLILPAFLTVSLVTILIPILFSVSGQMRFLGTSVFGDVSPLYKASEDVLEDYESENGQIGRIIHNRRFVYIPIIIENYLSHLNPKFLFFEADMERHHAPQVGLLYLWELPFLLAGFYFLTRNFDKKIKFIIFWWFLIAPLASAVTWGVPHSLRSEIYLPMFQIITAVGLYFILKNAKNSKILILTVAIALFINFAFYIHQYYFHLPVEYSEAWKFGRKEAALLSESMKNDYDRVVVSTKLEQPHEFWLYYLKYDPQKYLKEGGTVSGGFLENRNKFDKYLFRPIDYEKQKQEANTLFIGLPDEFPDSSNIIKSIYYLNGKKAIVISR